jgi:hypothetical protein
MSYRIQFYNPQIKRWHRLVASCETLAEAEAEAALHLTASAAGPGYPKARILYKAKRVKLIEQTPMQALAYLPKPIPRADKPAAPTPLRGDVELIVVRASAAQRQAYLSLSRVVKVDTANQVRYTEQMMGIEWDARGNLYARVGYFADTVRNVAIHADDWVVLCRRSQQAV